MRVSYLRAKAGGMSPYRQFHRPFVRARAVWHEHGPLEFVRRAVALMWRHSMRRLMPVRRACYWSGVRTFEQRALDNWLMPHGYPRKPCDIPNYEEALVEGLHRLVRPGDRVVIVGGGSA